MHSRLAWSRGGRARGFNSDTAAAAYAEAARDTSRSGTEWDRTGDVKAALSQAAATIEAEYQCDYAYHAQMEPLNAVAAVSPDGSRAEIWCGTQSQTMAAAAAAKALGIAPEQVVLHSMLLGGGFGRRGHRDEEFIVDAVLLSQAVRPPRQGDLDAGGRRPEWSLSSYERPPSAGLASVPAAISSHGSTGLPATRSCHSKTPSVMKVGEGGISLRSWERSSSLMRFLTEALNSCHSRAALEHHLFGQLALAQ
jgi:CO/xanthine dehydrogenase Mo-binding subunit